MTRFLYLLLIFIVLSGCVGDRLVFREKGDASVNKSSICIKSSSNDVLSYYNLSSSVNSYSKPLVAESNIIKEFPDTCIKVDLKPDEDYTLLYVLNSIKYRFEFSVDKRWHVTNTTKG